jgi:hypothetical protein
VLLRLPVHSGAPVWDQEGRRVARMRLRDCPAVLGASRRGEKPRLTSPGRRPAALEIFALCGNERKGARAPTISPGLSPAPVVREPPGPHQKIDPRPEGLEGQKGWGDARKAASPQRFVAFGERVEVFVFPRTRAPDARGAS